MKLTPEQLIDLLCMHDKVENEEVVVFGFDSLPKTLPVRKLPIVDRKHEIMICADSGLHAVYTATLGTLCGASESDIVTCLKNIKDGVDSGLSRKESSFKHPAVPLLKIDRMLTDMFLDNGYFISSAGGFNKVIIGPNYHFDSFDRMLARRYSLDLHNVQEYNPMALW
jgi:hypothetical protein